MGRSRNTRGNTSTANRGLRFSQTQYGLTPFDLSRQIPFDFSKALSEIEDRRTFHPEGPFRPAATLSSRRTRLVASGYPKLRQQRSRVRSQKFYVPVGVAFEAPRDVAICVRRRQRREVLHAYRKTGRGGQRRPRRNWYSKVRCS